MNAFGSNAIGNFPFWMEKALAPKIATHNVDFVEEDTKNGKSKNTQEQCKNLVLYKRFQFCNKLDFLS